MIPDYLIYDELKRRREREATPRVQLELPLYQPHAPTSALHDPESEAEDDGAQRGIFIIDMNDMFDLEDE